MTLSYSIGLTCGSAVAYLLDAILGAHVQNDVCSVNNSTTSILVSTTINDSVNPPITTWLDTLSSTLSPNATVS